MKIDYLIIGQGIAGSLLSFKLLEQGKSVLVVDENKVLTSSKVAAGLYNPIVFKRIVKSWMVDEALPVADSFYSQMEDVLNCKFHRKREIVKLFTSEEEKNFWLTKSQNPELEVYLAKEVDDTFMSNEIQNISSSSIVKQAGYVHLPQMLSSMKAHLLKLNAYIETNFNYNDLILTDEGVDWKGISARRIIFCEGNKATTNPYFDWLPFVLTKGEVLIIRMENFLTEKVIVKGVFILPLGDNLFKVGATYEWKDLTELPTEKGRSELLEKLTYLLKVPFEVIDQQCGIRPTVRDRRPLIGLHPKHKQLGFFNGLGTKAVLLAPYFATQFAGFLNDSNDLHKEADLKRYYKETNT